MAPVPFLNGSCTVPENKYTVNHPVARKTQRMSLRLSSILHTAINLDIAVCESTIIWGCVPRLIGDCFAGGVDLAAQPHHIFSVSCRMLSAA